MTLEEITPGSEILEGEYTATILTVGWGSGDGDEEAILFLADAGKGTVWWRAILYSLAGFER